MDIPILYTGDHLRMKRQDAGLSQDELSKLTGIPQGRISNIESGSNFTKKTLIKILDAISKYQSEQSQTKN